MSCETAAASALAGVLTDPRTLDVDLDIPQPEHFEVNDNLVIPPVEEGHEDEVEVVRGPNIHPFPLGKATMCSVIFANGTSSNDIYFRDLPEVLGIQL